MAEPVFLIAAAFLLLLGALTLRKALRIRRLVATLAILTPQPIETATLGFQQAHGKIEAIRAIPSAFHKRACVYFAFRVEEPTLGPTPKRLAVGKDWGEAAIIDASGRARLEHRTALVRAAHEHVTELRDLKAIPAEHAEFFERAGIGERHLGRFKVLRIVEYTLEPGDEVYVTGWLDQDEDGKVFYRARRSPMVVSAEADTRLIPGLKNELLLFSLATVLLLTFSLLFFGFSLA